MIEKIQKQSFAIVLRVFNQILTPAGKLLSKEKVDLSGRKCNFILKRADDKREDDENAIIDRTFTLLGEDAENGKIVISLSSQDTDLPISVYKLQVETSNGPTGDETIYTHYQSELKITNNLKKDNI